MTAQMHEKLILDGEEVRMAFCPPIPEQHPRIFEPADFLENEALITSCWRAYQGTWEVKDDRFYLVDLWGRYRLRKGEPLLAEWFTGVLRIPKGNVLHRVHMGFGTIYEEEVHIKIEKGIVVTRRVIDNRGKQHDLRAIGWNNLPGDENRFPGDDEL